MYNSLKTITFCRNKCCPTVTVRPGGKVVLGDSQGPEGVTIWTKQNFADFLEAAKAGRFDHIVADEKPEGAKCPCGLKPEMECKENGCSNPEKVLDSMK